MSSLDPNNPENVQPTDPANSDANPNPGQPAGDPPPTDPAFNAPPPPPPGPNATPHAPPVYGAADAASSLANPTKDERNWAMFSHLSAIIVGILATAVSLPILSFLGPLIIYLIKKDESPYVADQAREALNFNITVSIVMLVLFVLSFTIILLILTVPAMIVIGVAALILSIMAAIKASNGELYRYPFIIRLIN